MAANAQDPSIDTSEGMPDVLRTLLYEGYRLFPYRRSALKNQYRWNFGVLFPKSFADAQGGSETAWLRAEVPIEVASAEAMVVVRVAFLEESSDGTVREHWIPQPFSMAELSGAGRRRELTPCPFRAELEVRVRGWPGAHPTARLLVTLRNLEEGIFESRDQALGRALIAAHLLVSIDGGRLFSIVDPPPRVAETARRCRSRYTWPALVAHGSSDRVLCSPLIVGDYPRIAPSSPASLFDGTEVEELLHLSLRAFGDDELEALRMENPRLHELVRRARELPERELLGLHADSMHRTNETASRARSRFRRGDRVKLTPRKRGDIWDEFLRDQSATVVGVDWDLEGRCHVSVVVDGDPGADLGEKGFPGHRFFFSEEDVEPA